jgi:hypothetical protein
MSLSFKLTIDSLDEEESDLSSLASTFGTSTFFSYFFAISCFGFSFWTSEDLDFLNESFLFSVSFFESTFCVASSFS